MLASTMLVLAVVMAAPPLRLGDLLAEVSAAAPAVSVADADVAVGRAAVGVAGTWEDPTFSVMGEAIPIRMAEDSDPTMISYRVGQQLNLFGRRRLAKRVARSDVARREAGLRRTTWDARAQAVELFYELWMVDEMGRIIDEQIALLHRMREAGLALVRAGMGSMGHHDVLRAESEIAVMEAERASLEDERAAVAAMLNTLRGHAVDEAIGPAELPAEHTLPDLDVAVAAASGTPEVAAARAMKGAAAAQRDLARRMYWPMVMLEAEYEQNLDGMPDGLGIGISVTVPLWYWDRQDNEIAMARAMERFAGRESVAMVKMANAELRMAWSSARAAERKVIALEDSAIPKLRETIASTEAAYVAGTGAFISLLDAVMELKELEGKRVEAIVRRGVARFELDRIAGDEVAP
jgi:cobalt-zinc-cadmium efflux system outer membrane protein